ncbi:hypothetical protein D3C81_2202200 [compost metagenome]
MFLFSAFYSVLPDSKDYVLAGNGEIGTDGWITGRSFYVQAILRNGSVYSLVSMSTGL